jgi:hypothetical protein
MVPPLDLHSTALVGSVGAGGANMDDTGLLAYYTFEEAGGTIENKSQSGDSVGTAGDGTVTGATYRASGVIGDCLSYDGTNDKCTFGTVKATFNEVLSATAKWSIILWLYPDTFVKNDIVLDSANSTNSNKGIDCRLESTGGAMTFTIAENGSIVQTGTTTATLTQSAWNMVAITYDYSLGSANLRFSINDGTVETDNKIKDGLGGTPTYDLTLAEAAAGNDNPFDGKADEFSFWNRVLTDAEITTLYNSGSGFSIY